MMGRGLNEIPVGRPALRSKHGQLLYPPPTLSHTEKPFPFAEWHPDRLRRHSCQEGVDRLTGNRAPDDRRRVTDTALEVETVLECELQR